MVSDKITTLKFLLHTGTWPASLTLIITQTHFFFLCGSKTAYICILFLFFIKNLDTLNIHEYGSFSRICMPQGCRRSLFCLKHLQLFHVPSLNAKNMGTAMFRPGWLSSVLLYQTVSCFLARLFSQKFCLYNQGSCSFRVMGQEARQLPASEHKRYT